MLVSSSPSSADQAHCPAHHSRDAPTLHGAQLRHILVAVPNVPVLVCCGESSPISTAKDSAMGAAVSAMNRTALAPPPGAFASLRRTLLAAHENKGGTAGSCAWPRLVTDAIASMETGIPGVIASPPGMPEALLYIRRIRGTTVVLDAAHPLSCAQADALAVRVFALAFASSLVSPVSRNALQRLLDAASLYTLPLGSVAVPFMPLVPETHAMLRPILASHAARTRCPVSVVLWQGQVACYTPDWMHLTNLEQLVMVVVAARYLTRSSGFAQDICLHDTSPTVQHRLIGFNVGGLGLAVVSLTSARHAQLGVGDLAIPDVWQSIPHSIHGMDSALLADMPWLQGLHAHIPTHQASILVLRTDVRVAVKRWLTVVELERELNPSVDRVILASVTVLDNTIATVYWRRYAMIDLMLLLDASIPESSLERIAVQVATLVLAFVQ